MSANLHGITWNEKRTHTQSARVAEGRSRQGLLDPLVDRRRIQRKVNRPEIDRSRFANLRLAVPDSHRRRPPAEHALLCWV